MGNQVGEEDKKQMKLWYNYEIKLNCKVYKSKLWFNAIAILHDSWESFVSTDRIIIFSIEVTNLFPFFYDVFSSHFFWIKESTLCYKKIVLQLFAILILSKIHLQSRKLNQFIYKSHDRDIQPKVQLSLV